MLRRTPGWEQRLATVEQELSRTVWRYGKHDCAQACLRVVHAISGVDLREQYAYNSRQAARRLMRHSIQGKRRTDVRWRAFNLANILGLEQVEPDHLQRGDPCLVRVGRSYALGWIASNGQGCVAAELGFVRLDRMQDVVLGWRIPCQA